jgi:predicted dithiol-disulfide oxidoreductase (DUF899 family)
MRCGWKIGERSFNGWHQGARSMLITGPTKDIQDCCAAHDVALGETVAAAGAEVSAHRSNLDSEIEMTEAQIGGLQKKIAELRARRPQEVVKKYEFLDWNGATLRLSQLFGKHRDLILVHNMGVGCAYCTLWADGFIGLRPHLESRAAFVVASPDPADVQRSFAQARGWNFRMVSAHGTAFFDDMGFVDGRGDPMPGVSTFRRESEETIVRIQRAEFGPGDQFCAAWHLFDLLADGVGDWQPQFSYR